MISMRLGLSNSSLMSLSIYNHSKDRTLPIPLHNIYLFKQIIYNNKNTKQLLQYRIFNSNFKQWEY